MYTRNFGRQKYNPPPGYDGTAFGGMTATKHHEPMEMIRTDDREIVQEDPENALIAQETDSEELPERDVSEEQVAEHPLRQLIESIRGKIGTEELIILLVMMLIASDGFGIEMLVLGILLSAGS